MFNSATYNLFFTSLLPFEGKIQNQSGAWYAEVVDLAVIRKLEKIKTLQGFKKISGWESTRNLQWVTQGMSNCKRSIKANL